jgi:hypothetical protein
MLGRRRAALAATVQAQATAITELREEVAELRAGRETERSPTTRRGLLAAAGGAAAGALALKPGDARAADGDPLLVGSAGNAASNGTKLATSQTSGDCVWIDHSGASVSTVVAATSGAEAISVYGRTAGFSPFPAGKAAVLGVSTTLTGVKGQSGAAEGVLGRSQTGPAGVKGERGASGLTPPAAGVAGDGSDVPGVVGASASDVGVVGTTAGSGAGVRGDIPSGAGTAVHARTAGTGPGLIVETTSTSRTSPAAKITEAGTNTGLVVQSVKGRGATFQGKIAALRIVPTSSAGAPTTGAHQPGDLIVDSTGNLFLCTASGTPGTWRQVQLV